ncbi:DUF722 domain-containing protein [Clostridium baratii]|uniref:DUF722 domain-containing protein n=1 Tax=Clostridium baratii TaxID=1561 RepID=UPI003D7A1995
MDKKIFKKVENILSNYNTIKATIKNQLLEIEIISKTYQGTSSISYEEKTGPTYKITSSVENEILEKERRIKQLEKEIISNQNMINMIDNALDILSDSEKKLVKLRYFNFNQLSWDQIGYNLGFSGDYCRTKLRNKVIKHMYYMLFVNPYKQFKFENF